MRLGRTMADRPEVERRRKEPTFGRSHVVRLLRAYASHCMGPSCPLTCDDRQADCWLKAMESYGKA